MSLPRGIRNNNPGNIDYNPKNKWKGMLPHDTNIEPRFCRFTDPVYGIRACAKLLGNYQSINHLNTVRAILSKYAPSIENNTAGYIQRVCKKVGVQPDEPIILTDEMLYWMVKAIFGVENNTQGDSTDYSNYYEPELIRKGIKMVKG